MAEYITYVDVETGEEEISEIFTIESAEDLEALFAKTLGGTA